MGIGGILFFLCPLCTTALLDIPGLCRNGAALAGMPFPSLARSPLSISHKDFIKIEDLSMPLVL